MVSWNEGSSSSSNDESVTSQLPRNIPCYGWSGISHEFSSRCLHLEPCLRLVSYESMDSGRRFLACAKEKFYIAELWSMYDKENKDRLRDNVKLGELGNARLALSDLKEDIEKNKLADHGCTNLHQVLRAKTEKERDQLVLERDQVKQEKKRLEYIISHLTKQKHGYKDKIKKLKENCDEF
ncbi:hypothetical protein D1007_03696 [Hordeum vulgare]|nr:hypothetical protein D1007_03696 [Hordeum vulgare]